MSPAAHPLDIFGVLPTVNKTVEVKANGSGALDGETAPPIGTTYHLEATCTGTYDGGSVPLSNPKVDI